MNIQFYADIFPLLAFSGITALVFVVLATLATMIGYWLIWKVTDVCRWLYRQVRAYFIRRWDELLEEERLEQSITGGQQAGKEVV